MGYIHWGFPDFVQFFQAMAGTVPQLRTLAVNYSPIILSFDAM